MAGLKPAFRFFRTKKIYEQQTSWPAIRFFRTKKIYEQQTSWPAIRSFSEGWWIRPDLNRGPGDYESPALTD